MLRSGSGGKPAFRLEKCSCGSQPAWSRDISRVGGERWGGGPHARRAGCYLQGKVRMGTRNKAVLTLEILGWVLTMPPYGLYCVLRLSSDKTSS